MSITILHIFPRPHRRQHHQDLARVSVRAGGAHAAHVVLLRPPARAHGRSENQTVRGVRRPRHCHLQRDRAQFGEQRYP